MVTTSARRTADVRGRLAAAFAVYIVWTAIGILSGDWRTGGVFIYVVAVLAFGLGIAVRHRNRWQMGVATFLLAGSIGSIGAVVAGGMSTVLLLVAGGWGVMIAFCSVISRPMYTRVEGFSTGSPVPIRDGSDQSSA